MQIQLLSDIEIQKIYDEMKRIVHGTQNVQNQRIKIHDGSEMNIPKQGLRKCLKKFKKTNLI